MNICLLGNNLTNLVLANILLNKKFNVDIISQNNPSLLINTIRTHLMNYILNFYPNLNYKINE